MVLNCLVLMCGYFLLCVRMKYWGSMRMGLYWVGIGMCTTHSSASCFPQVVFLKCKPGHVLPTRHSFGFPRQACGEMRPWGWDNKKVMREKGRWDWCIRERGLVKICMKRKDCFQDVHLHISSGAFLTWPDQCEMSILKALSFCLCKASGNGEFTIDKSVITNSPRKEIYRNGADISRKCSNGSFYGPSEVWLGKYPGKAFPKYRYVRAIALMVRKVLVLEVLVLNSGNFN